MVEHVSGTKKVYGAFDVNFRRIVLTGPNPVQSIVLLGIVYLLAWGTLFLSLDGLWWDDWVSPLGIGTTESMVEQGHQLGRSYFIPIGMAVTLLGTSTSHLVILALFFVAGLAVWGVLGTISYVSQWERLFVSALFLVLPLMSTRFAINLMPYAIANASFFVGWFALVRRPSPPAAVKALGALLFLTSFTIESFLVFYVVPIAHLWLRAAPNGRRSLRIFLHQWWPLGVVPFAFFSVKLQFFTAKAAYTGYNSLTFNGLVSAALTVSFSALPLVAFLSFRSRLGSKMQLVLAPACVGITLLGLAVAPYLAVGHEFPFRGLDSRDEILMPLGTALFLLALVRAIRLQTNSQIAATFAVMLVALSTVASAVEGYRYYIDWNKQLSLVRLMAENEDIRSGSLIVFKDNTLNDNIEGVTYNFYAWNGLMVRAFGNSNRLGLNPKDVRRYLSGEYDNFYGPDAVFKWGASNFREGTSIVVVTIESRSTPNKYVITTRKLPISELSLLGAEQG